MRSGQIILGLALIGALISGAAHATTQSVTANISFDAPLSQTKISDIKFGTVKAGQPGTYILSTANTVTPSNGGVWLSGSPSAASITVAGSSKSTVTVSTGSYVANNGVTPSAATCKYGTEAAAPCDSGIAVAAPGIATNLLVGVQVVADGTQSAGSTATPSFTVSVIYN